MTSADLVSIYDVARSKAFADAPASDRVIAAEARAHIAGLEAVFSRGLVRAWEIVIDADPASDREDLAEAIKMEGDE